MNPFPAAPRQGRIISQAADQQEILPRQVFYMPGFDPREPETYWGLFRRESRLTAMRRAMTIEVGDPVRSPDGLSLAWTVRGGSPDAQTDTRYVLLRWDDIVRARFPRSNGRRLVEVPALWWRLYRCGYVRNFRREARRFARVILGVHAIFLALVGLSLTASAALVALTPLGAGPLPLALAMVPVLAYALLALTMVATRGKPLYLAHLIDDTAFTHDHASGAETAMHARLDALADRIRAAEGESSEIVVVGHSSSSFLAVEALDRALARDPGFGLRGTPVSLLTIGSVIPWIALDPLAVATRAALGRVAASDAVAWLDIRAPWDWLSIHLRDPLAASGLPSPGPDRPAAIRVRLHDLIEPAILARRRWNLFRMHFQLLMASRDPTAFDYIALVAGPEPVRTMIERCRASSPGAMADAR